MSSVILIFPKSIGKLASITSQEVKFLDTLDELNLNQYVSGPTRKSHNTLDIILSNVDKLSVSIGTKFFPIITRSSFIVTSI